MRTTFAAVALGLLLSGASAVAHHSFTAEFDANLPINLKGTVTKVEWMNPHTWFYIDVKGDDGKVQNWALEMGSPNGLMRMGWTRQTLKIGDEVQVQGTRARIKPTVGSARVVTLASTGQRLFGGSNEADAQKEDTPK